MTVQPEVLFRNILKIAQEGRGDGTVYASATGATVDQDNKTFTLSGLSIISDLGSDADDKFNGYILTFTSSERSYLITDWDSTNDKATVFGYPNADDTGACEIRRTLYTDDFNPSNPLRYACNGDLSKKWIDKAANNTAIIQACMPNGIDNGGAESGDFTGCTAGTTGGTTGSVTVNSSSPLLGTYDFKFTIGDRTDIYLDFDPGEIDLLKGRTYGIIFKAVHDGANTDQGVYVTLKYVGNDANIPVILTKIDSNDILAGTNSERWRPLLSNSAEWEEITFTVPDDISAGDWYPQILADSTSEANIQIDGIYLFEVIRPDTLIIAGHNMAGGFPADSEVNGLRTDRDRTGFTDPEDVVVKTETAKMHPSGSYDSCTFPTTNPSNAYDGDDSTFTQVVTTTGTFYIGRNLANDDQWDSAPSWVSSPSLTLKVAASRAASSGAQYGIFLTDSAGSIIATLLGLGTTTVAKQTYTYDVSAYASDLADLRVIVNVTGGSFPDGDVKIYDVWIEGDVPNPLFDLSTVTVNGNSAIYDTTTPTPSIAPIFEIVLEALSGKTWEASEIWVGGRWTWDRFISGGWNPVKQDIVVASVSTLGGHKKVSERYRKKLRAGTISFVDIDELARWESFIEEVGLSKPFWYYIKALSDFGLSSELILMRNVSLPEIPMSADRFLSVRYEFEEVL